MVGFYDFSNTDNESAIEEIILQAQDACDLDQLSAINCSGTDTDNESAIEEIILQARDAYDLEQLSAINCSGITNSVLPSHLETRFCNLKSKQNQDSGYISSHDKKGVGEKPKDGSVSSPPFTPSSEESSKSSIFKPAQKECSKQDSPPRSSSSPSPSHPRRRGCLWCSPKKKEQKKKSKENRDEFLSSLGSFSMKELQKRLKKAMKEEEKVSRKAEKVVQWAKQASARMKASDIDDELSD